jgi:hypothetical protein
VALKSKVKETWALAMTCQESAADEPSSNSPAVLHVQNMHHHPRKPACMLAVPIVQKHPNVASLT